MQAYLDYGVERALAGHPDSLVRMINESYWYWWQEIPLPTSRELLEIYEEIVDDTKLDPNARDTMRRIILVYRGS